MVTRSLEKGFPPVLTFNSPVILHLWSILIVPELGTPDCVGDNQSEMVPASWVQLLD